MPEPRRLKALILDLDGLLIDSETWSWQAHDETLRRYGAAPLILEEIRMLVGLDAADEWRVLRELRSLPEEALHEYAAAQRDAFVTLRARLLAPLPGVRELLDAARELGLQVGLASNSPLRSVTAALEGLGIRPSFATIATVDQVERGKPAPDVYLLALDRLGIGADAGLAVEDSATGMKAALAAGLPCAVVPNAITAMLDFSPATARFDSLLQVAAWLPSVV